MEVEKPKETKTEPQAPDSPSTSEVKAKEIKDGRVGPPALGNTVVSSATDNKSDVVASLRNALENAAKKPKQFKNWTHSIHGLKLAILEEPDSGKPFRVLTVAVKNTTSASLKLVADGPELSVETVDDQGATVNVHSITKTHTEVSNTSGDIAAGKTAYFAIAYVPQTLDVHQRVKILVAQTNAADQPASLKLATSAR